MPDAEGQEIYSGPRFPEKREMTSEEFAALHAQLLARALTNPESFAYMEGGLYGNPVALGPRLPDAATWVAEQIEGASNNAEKWKRRVLAPKKNFKAEGVKANAAWKTGVQAAVAADRFNTGMAAVNEDDYVATIQATDPAVFSSGIERRRQKITSKVSRLRTAMLAHVQTMDSLPTDTLAQRKDKMSRNVDGMIALGQALRGGR